jgi:hypothetical protein
MKFDLTPCPPLQTERGKRVEIWNLEFGIWNLEFGIWNL